MSQEILVPNVHQANMDLLDMQLKAVAADDCYGVKGDINGLFIIVSDTAPASVIQQLKTIAQAHDPTQDTPAQAAEKAGKTDLANWLSAVDTALTDIASKKATLQGAQNIGNAVSLLNELSNDVTLALKALKYLAKKVM